MKAKLLTEAEEQWWRKRRESQMRGKMIDDLNVHDIRSRLLLGAFNNCLVYPTSFYLHRFTGASVIDVCII